MIFTKNAKNTNFVQKLVIHFITNLVTLVGGRDFLHLR